VSEQDAFKDGREQGRRDCAAEIARLRAENENLRRWKALDKPLTAAMEIANLAIDQRRAENDCLRAQRDQLLAALIKTVPFIQMNGSETDDKPLFEAVCAAIAAVEKKP
jgi:hypothetical protein